MAERNFTTRLAGQIGEALVVAELGRMDIVATSFAGNVPDIDLVAYFGGRTTHLQVKSWRTGSVHLNAARFLRISMESGRQVIHGIDASLDKALIYVFVKIGQALGGDQFYILTQGDLQEIVRRHHTEYLRKHNGVRPRNPDSTHMGLNIGDLAPYRDAWKIIEDRLK